jgi:hypothetical protein
MGKNECAIFTSSSSATVSPTRRRNPLRCHDDDDDDDDDGDRGADRGKRARSPKKIADPHASPTPLTASGRTNMLDPTVLPVTRSDADNTGMTSSIRRLPPLATTTTTGRFMFDINESTTFSAAPRPSGKLLPDSDDPSRVATDRDVLLCDLLLAL